MPVASRPSVHILHKSTRNLGRKQDRGYTEQETVSYLEIHGNTWREVPSYVGWRLEVSYVDVKAKASSRKLENLVFQVA